MTTWEQNKVGCILLEKKLAQPFKKGEKRTQKPALDTEKCTKCALCYLYCPDAAIKVAFMKLTLTTARGVGSVPASAGLVQSP